VSADATFARVIPSKLAIARLPQLMLSLPHAATSLEIQLLVRAWANDIAALGLSAR
jgi:hypothetical protein